MKTQIITMGIATLCLCMAGQAAMITLSPGDDIQSAIDTTMAGDTIQLAAGTYTITNELHIYNKGITIMGMAGALGTTIQRDSGAETNHRILFIEGAVGSYDQSTGTVISGLTLKNGIAALGGNVYVKESPFTVISNCIIENGFATQYGGGIDMEVGGTLFNSIVRNNSTANGSMNQGGGVYLRYGGNVIENSIINNNWADVGGGVAIQDSGIDNDPSFDGADSRVLIKNSTIADNYADGYAGFIFGGGVASQLQGKEAMIKDSIVWDNLGGANVSDIYNITAGGAGTLITTYTDTGSPYCTGTGNIYTDPMFNAAGLYEWDYYMLQDGSAALTASSTGEIVGAVLNTSQFVPEPATLSLLAFGCLALIRRRRAA